MQSILAFIGAFMGFSILENAKRRQGDIRPIDGFFAVLGGIGAWNYWSWLDGKTIDRLVPIAFLFLAASPVLGFFFFHHEGRWIKTVLKIVCGIGLWGLLAMCWWLWMPAGELLSAVVGSTGIMVLILAPWKNMKHLRQNRHRKKAAAQEVHRLKQQDVSRFSGSLEQVEYLMDTGYFRESYRLLDQLWQQYPEHQQTIVAYQKMVMRAETTSLQQRLEQRKSPHELPLDVRR